MKLRLQQIAREPLLHFLLLGAMIFAAHGWASRYRNSEPGRIVVSQGQIEALATNFARTWQRPPSAEELQGLVQEHVREEVYFREAVAMGLERDDTVIRRRLRQKLEFIADEVAVAEPTDDQLRVYLTAHPESFRREGSYSFRHVYLNPANHRNLARETARLLQTLRHAGAGADPAQYGDMFLLPLEFEAVTAAETAKMFGEKFAGRLADLEPGQWEGPIESGYGSHLVLVTERIPGRVPELAEMRDAVRREWQNAQRREASEKFYRSLLKRYTVVVEPAEPARVAAVSLR